MNFYVFWRGILSAYPECRQTISTAEPMSIPSPVVEMLTASLACYVSLDDKGKTRAEFLRDVSARIEMDLSTGEY